MFELNNFSSIQIGVASPEKIREWSKGEVVNGETINYRTQKPEKGGLFCEIIFGPTRSGECSCGRYKKKYTGTVCDKCGVLVTDSKVRRERMGHIELAAPVSHIWYYKGAPSAIGMCLDVAVKDLDDVLYLNKFIVIKPGKTEFTYKQVINDEQYREAMATYGRDSFKALMGAAAIKQLLGAINLDEEADKLKRDVAVFEGAKKQKAAKRLDIIESFRLSGNKPEWMVLDVIPVIPPEIRPMVPLDGGRYAASDLNDLYRRVINRNKRLKKHIEQGAPDLVVRNEKRMLQEAVDALFDNGRRGKATTGPGGRELKSLTGMLKGKQGRFRQNLLGKRVDYSGRSVIVVGPELKMYQCGLPKEMALELFKPFVIKKLVEYNHCANIRVARKFVMKATTAVWNILEDVIKDHPVLLNRAPTLHRLGIQAFEPILVEGRAIKLHPLACGAFNADFDGDQMAVHVPLSLEAQAEARFLMLATNNILKLSDGNPIVAPSQDMVIGAYYLSIDRNALVKKEDNTIEEVEASQYFARIKEGENLKLRAFKSFNEALMAYQLKEIGLQDIVSIRREMNVEIDVYGTKINKLYSKNIISTVGRFIFNEAIPQDLAFTKRYDQNKDICTDETSSDYNNPLLNLDLEIDFLVGKNQLSRIVENCFKYKGATETATVLDKIKSLGFKYSTIGAITTSVFDMHIPDEKYVIVADAEKKILEIEKKHRRGLLTENDRYNQVIDTWTKAKDEVNNLLEGGALGKFNPIYMMADSGARGSMRQIAQLCGMRGLVANTAGKTVELPIKSNYREGLSVLEYFTSSHGGRKGLADTALKTANSGYLTRRLVDVAQDCIINEEDCLDTKGFIVTAIMAADSSKPLEPINDRIRGRICMDDIVHPETGEIIIPANSMLTKDEAIEVEAAGVKSVRIRSMLSCRSKHGVCAKCYGANMASNNIVKIGEAVGVIAAQSIGEPGTQLTMRTFHTGGIATADDITQGLPRVEELFEVRRPGGEAILSEIDGSVYHDKEKRVITITMSNGETKEYKYNHGQKVTVENGDKVEAGTPLTKGSVFPQDMLRTRGVKGVQDYLIKEVQSAYRTSGVQINDKHTEIIIRQMLRKVRIETQGDTDMLTGDLYNIFKYEDNNEKALVAGGAPATAKRTLLGITKASLATDSFLSAASFQETAKVLTNAAIKNKTDYLVGLKENVLLGKVIPAGTGMKCYQNVDATFVDGLDLNINESDEYIDYEGLDLEQGETSQEDVASYIKEMGDIETSAFAGLTVAEEEKAVTSLDELFSFGNKEKE